MGDEEDTDDPKAMQFAKMDVPEAYMATNDEELVMKMEQVRSTQKNTIGSSGIAYTASHTS